MCDFSGPGLPFFSNPSRLSFSRLSILISFAAIATSAAVVRGTESIHAYVCGKE